MSFTGLLLELKGMRVFGLQALVQSSNDLLQGDSVVKFLAVKGWLPAAPDLSLS